MAQTQNRSIATGSDGNISFAALNSGKIPVGRFSSWNLSLGQVVNNVTQFATDGNVYQDFVGGCKSATWGATTSVNMNTATSNPYNTTVAATVGSENILPAGGATATFTVATAGIFSSLTACNIVWPVIVQSIGLGSDATGGVYQSIGGVCNGAPSSIAWDETVTP